MELELKHIVGYLPYGLRLNILNHKNDYCGIEFSNANGYYFIGESLHITYNLGRTGKSILEFKPILRPLSDLTKEIEFNGEKFSPIDKLNENGFTKYSLKYINFVPYLLAEYIAEYNVCTPYSAKEKLYEWHFDIHGLIKQGLAIDINTLK